jgi:hypothetical protein
MKYPRVEDRGPAGSSDEHGDEFSGSIKGGEFTE